MSRRAARIASAIFVNIIASLSFLTLAHAEPAPADNCLSNPKNETPAGSHWFYRTDHANKRNCWYLRPDRGGVAQALPQPSPQAPPPAAKPSFADARAEVRPQATVREDTPAASPPPPTAVNPAGGAGNDAGSTSVWNGAAPVATRWPDLPPSVSVPKTAVAAADTAGNVTQQAEPATTAAAASTASMADLPISIQPEMIPTLIAAAIGALVFAGIAMLISRHFRRRVRRRKAAGAQGPIWETTDDDRIVLSDHPAMDDYRPRFARGVPSAATRYRAAEAVQRAPRRARR